MRAKGQKPIIPWKRFWSRFGSPIHVGEQAQGFLTDPDGNFTKAYNPDLLTLDQLVTESCLILCGDPGMGKSTVLQQAKDVLRSSLGEDGYFIFLDFRDLPNEQVFARQTFDSIEWQSWRNSTGKLMLIIDGVDEGLAKIPDFISYLAAQIRHEPVERLKLILACRPAEWPVAQGNHLISMWGVFEKKPIYELCPLRQRDAELAAEKWNLSKRLFIENVYQKKLIGLAALPTTLFFLLDEFRENRGFCGTHRELYERGCQRLEREVDPRRAEVLRQLRKTSFVSPPQEVHETASRLAALLLICGKSAIHADPLEEADARSDLHISEAADNTVTENVILDTIASGLFTSRGPNRFGFAHQTFAECLAAQFLSKLPLVQIRSLLCARDLQDEHVAPQLAETSAWVAGVREDFFDHLCRIEPEVLLRSDVSKVQNQRKSILVEAILEKAKRVELFDERNIGRFFDTLKHPELAKQLQSFINDKSLHFLVRRMAMSIAGDCKEADLTDVLLNIIKDSAETQHIRDQAAHALEELIPRNRLSELIPLAFGQVGIDPDHTIRGCALRGLVPTVWSVSKALPAIHAPRKTHSGGSYSLLLKYHLPRYLIETDLPWLLGRMIRWRNCFDTLNWLENLSEAAFTMALLNLGKRDIRRLAVRVWVVKLLHHHPLPHSNDSQVIKLFKSDCSIRRAFVAAVINDPKTQSNDIHIANNHHVAIFQPVDFEWALNQIALSPVERREAWANVIVRASQPDTACQCWDLLLQRIEEIPELRTKFEWLKAWDLDEPIARKSKALWLKEQRRKKEFQRPEPNFDIEEMLKNALGDIAMGKTFHWIQLCDLLSLENGQTSVSYPLDYDLTESPGWKAANETRKNEIRAAARSFLLNHSDGYLQIGGRTNYFDPGYMAVWLLRNEVRKDFALKASVAVNWVEALIGHFNDGSDCYQETAALAYELNPEVTLLGFIRMVKEGEKQYGQVLCRFGFLKAWDLRFTAATLDLIREGTLQNKSIESLLTFLGPIAPTEAAACAKEFLGPEEISNSVLQDRTIAILSACLGAMPTATWDFAWPVIESDAVLAEKVLLRMTNHFNHDRKKFLPILNENQLAVLYLKLHHLFSPETDLPHNNNGYSGVSPEESVRWLRNDVINALEARGTEEACRKLLWLATILPDHAVWFRWRHYSARTSKRRMLWMPPSPQTVLLLARRNEGRLVKNADDLLEVVTESLARFQAHLTRSTLPRSEVLWRYEGADTRRRNFKPCDEALLSNEIARWLRDDLNQHGIVIGREVQPRQGQRTDIYVEAVARGGFESSVRTVTMVIEVKGCWNADVKTAADTQLIGDYMRLNGWMHGIYLVGWFVCAAWENPRNKLASKTLDLARQEVADIVSKYDGKTNPERVNAVVLDCGYPASSGA